jgi:O-antigen/teichoic acid export membrane protein
MKELSDSVAKEAAHARARALGALLGGEAKDALIFTSATLLQKFGGFFLVPLYWRRLTPEDYGVIAVIGIIGSFQGLLGSLSIEMSVTRFFYEWPEAERRRNLGAIWCWNWINTAACAALFLLVFPWISGLLFPGIDYRPYLMLGIIANAIGDLVVIPSTTIRIRRQPWLYALYNFTSFAVTTGLGLWFVVVRDEKLIGFLKAMIAANLVMAVLGAAVMFAFARPCLSSPGLRGAVRFALPALPANAIFTGGALLDRFLLSYFASLETLGLYALSVNFAELINGLHGSLKMAYSPFVMKQMSGDSARGARTVAAVTPYYLLPYFVAGLGLIYFIGPFVRLIDRPAYLPVLDWAPWLAGVTILNSLYVYYANGILLAKRSDLLAIPAGVQIGVLVLACALLIRPYELAGLVASRYLSTIAFLGLSVYLAEKVFPMPHEWRKLVGLGVGSLAFVALGLVLQFDNLYLEVALKTLSLAMFTGAAYWLLDRERRQAAAR